MIISDMKNQSTVYSAKSDQGIIDKFVTIQIFF